MQMQTLTSQTRRGPTDEEYKIVQHVYKETGLLTVKDKVTSEWVPKSERCGGVPSEPPFSDRPEYGEAYSPRAFGIAQAMRNNIGVMSRGGLGGSVGMSGVSDFDDVTAYVRSIEKDLVGSKRLPKGVVFGGVEVWRQDIPASLGGSQFRPILWWEDVSRPEKDRLAAWANDRVWVTNEMIEEEDLRRQKLREHKTETQMDPVGMVSRSLEKALERMSSKGAPSDEMLLAAGFTRDKDGNWVFLPKDIQRGGK